MAHMPFSFTSGKWHFTRNPTELLSNPFAKRKVTTKTDNFSKPATPDWMAQAPRGARGKQVIRKRTGFPKRQPVKRRSTKRKRSAPRGTFKKVKKPKKLDTKSVKRHYDDYGTLNRNYVLYMGFEAHGSKDRMWDIMAEAIAKACLAKMKIYPRSYDEAIGITNFDRIIPTFKRVNVPSGSDDLSVASAISFTAYSTLKTLSASWKQYLAYYGDITSAEKHAYFLDSMTILNSANIDINQIIIKDIGESMVEFKSSQLIKLQNLTPNNDNATALDVIGTNPLTGMKYEFKNHRAKLISEIQALSATYDVLQENTATGFLPGFQAANADDRLVQLPKARQVFTNCSGSTSISMAPGAFKAERTSFTMKHKMSTFVERIYYGGFDKGSWGGVTWFGFERAHRQVATATHAAEDSVKIGFNRELFLSCSVALKTQKSSLTHYDNTSLGALGVQ